MQTKIKAFLSYPILFLPRVFFYLKPWDIGRIWSENICLAGPKGWANTQLVITYWSHWSFNEFLSFDRENSKGKRLNIPSGTAVRFEPGQTREVELIDFKGKREIFGFNQKIMGAL